jgi:hypothetical protein
MFELRERVPLVSHGSRALIHRIFALDGCHVLILYRYRDSEIYNVVTRETTGSFGTYLGLRGLAITNAVLSGNQPPGPSPPPSLLPCAVSMCCTTHSIAVTGQGMSMSKLSSLELPKLPTGIFPIPGDPTRFVVSSKDFSALVVVSNSQLSIDDNPHSIKRDGQTLALWLPAPGSRMRQFTRHGFVEYGRSDHVDGESISASIELFAVGRDRIVYYANSRLSLSSSGEKGTVHYPFDKVTCIELYEQHLAIGTEKGLTIREASTDTTRFSDAILTDPMPEAVRSLRFIPGDSLRIAIGLSNGGLEIGIVDRDRRHLSSHQTFALGMGPVFLSLLHHNTIIATCSRPWVLHIEPLSVRQTPLNTNPFCFATPVADNTFLACRGQSLFLFTLGPESRTSTKHIVVPDIPIAVTAINGSRYAVVLTKTTLSLRDLVTGRSYDTYSSGDDTFMRLFPSSQSKLAIRVGVLCREKPSNQPPSKQPPSNQLMSLRVFGVSATSLRFVGYLRLTGGSTLAVHGDWVAVADEGALTLYRLDGETYLTVARHEKKGGLATSVSLHHDAEGRKVYIAWGDWQRAVSLIVYDLGVNRFRVIAEEGIFRPIMTLELMLAPGRAMAGGDRLGDVFLLDIDAERGRFVVRYNFNVGDVVTSVCRTMDQFAFHWYQTAGGIFGGFMTPPDSFLREKVHGRMRLLRVLELEVADFFFRVTRGDRFAFRNRTMPCAVVDLDICEVFLQLSEARRHQIADKVSERLRGPDSEKVLSVQFMEIEIRAVISQFWLWHSTPL